MSEKRISVEYSQKDIEKALLARLKDPADSKLAETIVGYLSTIDHGLPGLMKALMGSHPSCKYKKGDMVWVKFSILPSWKMDKTETKTLPHYSSSTTHDREGIILCQITDTMPYQPNPYQIAYSAFESGKVIKELTYMIGDYSIAYKEESFLDILDSLGKVKETHPPEDDQPF